MFPAGPVAGGEQIGYAWVSASDRSLERQRDALAAVGCRRIFADDNPERPALRSLLDHARPGDALVVRSLDRVCQSLAELVSLAGQLRSGGLEFKSLREILDTTAPGGRMIFHVFAAQADFLVGLGTGGIDGGAVAVRRGQRRGWSAAAGELAAGVGAWEV
jgi:DNA invertase Pin-like site-specific DNA recombinase